MAREVTVAMIMKHAGVRRETVYSLREGGAITPVRYTALRKPLYPEGAIKVATRARELMATRMEMSQVLEVLLSD